MSKKNKSKAKRLPESVRAELLNRGVTAEAANRKLVKSDRAAIKKMLAEPRPQPDPFLENTWRILNNLQAETSEAIQRERAEARERLEKRQRQESARARSWQSNLSDTPLANVGHGVYGGGR